MWITNGTLVTLDPERPVLQGGVLRIQGERFVAIESGGAPRLGPDEELVDASGMLVMPGLISAHTRLYQSLLRGVLAAVPQAINAWAGVEEALSFEHARYAALWASIEAIRAGVTTVFDQHAATGNTGLSLDAVAEALLQSGLRGCLSYRVSERRGQGQARREIQENARFARRVASEPTLRGMMGLESGSLLTDEILQAAVGAAAAVDIGFSATVGRYRGEARDYELKHHASPIARMRQYGVLGPRTSLVTREALDPDDIETLLRTRTTPVRCVRQDMHTGWEIVGTAPNLHEQMRAGLPVALGSGGLSIDVLSEVQTAYGLCAVSAAGGVHPRGCEFVGRWLVAAAELASRVFRDRLGVLAPGALADVILVAYPSASLVTAQDWAWHLLQGLNAGQVHTTIVHGRVLMRNRELLSLDEQSVLARVRAMAADLGQQLQP